MFICRIYNHNCRDISTIYLYITRLTSNEIFSLSNKIHREVGGAKDLSAPPRTWVHSPLTVLIFNFVTGEWGQLRASFFYFVFGQWPVATGHWPLFPAANTVRETGCNDWGVSSLLQTAIPRQYLKLRHDCCFCIQQSLCNSDCMGETWSRIAENPDHKGKLRGIGNKNSTRF
jgi:hypothetical protein